MPRRYGEQSRALPCRVTAADLIPAAVLPPARRARSVEPRARVTPCCRSGASRLRNSLAVELRRLGQSRLLVATNDAMLAPAPGVCRSSSDETPSTDWPPFLPQSSSFDGIVPARADRALSAVLVDDHLLFDHSPALRMANSRSAPAPSARRRSSRKPRWPAGFLNCRCRHTLSQAAETGESAFSVSLPDHGITSCRTALPPHLTPQYRRSAQPLRPIVAAYDQTAEHRGGPSTSAPAPALCVSVAVERGSAAPPDPDAHHDRRNAAGE